MSSCPVGYGKEAPKPESGPSSSQPNIDSCPVMNPTSSSIFVGDSCPVKNTESYNTAANDLVFENQKDEKSNLSTIREHSTIPKSEFTPNHQPGGNEKWIYPSEQQYYNAMKRKGYNPDAKDIPIVLMIHNMVNERGWSQILMWEAQKGSYDPKLVRFQGRPQDISPKARMMNFIGYTLPFDRHDWIVDRNGKEIRYVIDFYNGSSAGHSSPVSMHLDVRPALDSVSSFLDRIRFFIHSQFSPKSMHLPMLKFPALMGGKNQTRPPSPAPSP